MRGSRAGMRPPFGSEPSRTVIIAVDKRNVKYYCEGMATEKSYPLKEAASLLGKKGGKARAEKYDAETLSHWGSLGGRPRKPSDQITQQGKWARVRREKKREQGGR